MQEANDNERRADARCPSLPEARASRFYSRTHSALPALGPCSSAFGQNACLLSGKLVNLPEIQAEMVSN